MAFDLDPNYIDVAARIAEFRAKHPAGWLAPLDPAQPFQVVDLNQRIFIVVVAGAFREPGDTQPGVGMAWEPFPGTTPYTRNSELQNAETAAWGRAIIAVGAADSKRGVASAEEVRNRTAERADQPSRDGWQDYGSMAGGYTDETANKGSDWRPPANPATRKADRHNAGRKGPLPDDQWTAVSGTTGEVNPAPEAAPGTATPDQVRDIPIRLSRKGITTREGKIAFCSQHTNPKRTVTSSAELSYAEAIDILRKIDELPALASPARAGAPNGGK